VCRTPARSLPRASGGAAAPSGGLANQAWPKIRGRRPMRGSSYPSNCRPMISFMISFVPPKIACTRESTKAFAMGYSSM
jgi:hypothetical protein